MAQNVSVWLFTHLRVIAVASFLCCHFSDTQVEIIFIRKWYLMLHINIFLCHLCFSHSLLAAGLPFLYALPPAHSPGIIPLGYFLSFSLSAGQLLLPPLLSLLNSGFFPIYLLFYFLFHHYFFAQMRNILHRSLRIMHPNQFSCSSSATQIY